MDKSTEQILSKKINLIYEYNNNSPLFVRIASKELEQNNILQAFQILEKGLKLYPNHPVAYFLLGKTFALKGKINKALEYFKKGSELIQSKETYDYYVKEIESIKKQQMLFEESRGNIFTPDLGDNSFTSNESEVTDNHEPAEKSNTAIEDNLDKLAKEVSKAKISALTDSEFKETLHVNKISGDNLIISETLAKIYVAQEEYDEAIKVYEKLIKKEPAKQEYYSAKINEIRSKHNEFF